MNLVVAAIIGVIAFAGFMPVGIHAALLAVGSVYLTYLLVKRMKTLDEKFKIHILPKLWNEL
jgi:membrane protein implicated in regulation of membrane protease activity